MLMIEKGFSSGLCLSIDRYAKANNKYMRNYDKNKESSHLKYWNVNNLHDWEISQKLPVNGLKWVEDLSEFNEDIIQSYKEKINEGYFLEIDVQFT